MYAYVYIYYICVYIYYMNNKYNFAGKYDLYMHYVYMHAFRKHKSWLSAGTVG